MLMLFLLGRSYSPLLGIVLFSRNRRNRIGSYILLLILLFLGRRYSIIFDILWFLRRGIGRGSI